jgi:hypothetical protein
MYLNSIYGWFALNRHRRMPGFDRLCDVCARMGMNGVVIIDGAKMHPGPRLLMLYHGRQCYDVTTFHSFLRNAFGL